MPGPPAKKRRTNDDEDGAPAQPKTRTRRAAPKPKAVANPKPPEDPKLPKRRTAKKKMTGKYTALHQFFGVPPGEGFPAPTASGSTTTASQNEDANDLIEDSDGGIARPPPGRPQQEHKSGKANTLEPHFVVSKPGVAMRFTSSPTEKGVRSSSFSTRVPSPAVAVMESKQEDKATVTDVPPCILTQPSDPRTWVERYEPRTVDELALNKTKVKEVRVMLEDMLDGSSRKRILVLTGPAGVGKTATVNALAKELGVEILEWRNPTSFVGGREYGEEGAFAAGFSGLFEEFLSRAGTFGCLELVSSTGIASSSPSSHSDLEAKKFIVIEDFPNTLFTSSAAPLESFRKTLKYYLAVPSTTTLPPLILIITETASVSGPNSFTAHRLLSPEILHHPLVKEIPFNKIAPSYMFKALSAIVNREALTSGRTFGPSKGVLDALSTSGDIRSAIMGLEFLSMNSGLSNTGFTERISQSRRRGKPEERPLTSAEKALVTAVTQRENSFGLFHALGKVLYNKRYGDDVDDPYVPPQIHPPLPDLPYHARAARIDLETLIDDTGTDPQTFIAGLHENYLLSCNPGGVARLPTSDEDVIDTVINCIDNFSDADLLSSPRFSYDTATDTAGIRADEISFHTAVRGTLLSLPSPVRRFLEPKGGANKMFFPTSARLWRPQQEVDEVVEWYVAKDRARGACRGGKMEVLLERMPYLALVERRKIWRKSAGVDLQTRKALERTTAFKGVGGRSEEVVDEPDEEEVDNARGKWRREAKMAGGWFEEVGAGMVGVESLVLSDDDIEDDW
ncbi:Rad17 cell cycle checkpoint protein-domain-containing protein [Sphaerosporella brunnea]|uniref:Rad17 cell cycle checkpoint protein-domain-containing protein n=1 Tax=Sphaerosporella brunnea TaxID=1250544 RepID=A0A5J5FBE5_9PEZI|nr:Rad17 cell cycle checkpoint protein-domain-containing protein [Sphaerosporella brunnea]